MIDPITLSVIPEDRLVVVKEGAGEWTMDALVLLKNVLCYNNLLNPLTRSPLSDDVLTCLDKYRVRQVRLFVVVDTDAQLQSKKRVLTLTFNSFETIGDVLAGVSLKRDKGKCIASIVVELDGESLYTRDLDSELESFERVTTVYVRSAMLTDSEYSRIKEYVGKYDRFKHVFSPFPEHINRARVVSFLNYVIEEVAGRVFPSDTPQVALTTHSAPRSTHTSAEWTQSDLRQHSYVTTSPMTEEEKSTLVGLLGRIATPDRYTWYPLYSGSVDEDGCWSLWGLEEVGTMSNFPVTYRLHPMPAELVECIESYSPTNGAEVPSVSRHRVTYVDRMNLGLPLPPPVTTELMFDIRSDSPPGHHQNRLSPSEVRLFRRIQHRVVDEGGYTWNYTSPGAWVVMHLSEADNYPVNYAISPMCPDLVDFIDTYNSTRSVGKFPVTDSVRWKIRMGLPLPSPITAELIESSRQVQVSTVQSAWFPIYYHSDGLYVWDVFCPDTPPTHYSGEVMDAELASAIASGDVTHPRIGINARETVRGGRPLSSTH